MEAGNGEWQRNFGTDYLPIQLELAKDENSKIVELSEGYNFVNWLVNWFSLVWELYGVEVRHIETEMLDFQT
jgi:hypothetical protein